MSFNDLINELRRRFGQEPIGPTAPAARDAASAAHGEGPLCFIVDDEAGIRRFIAGAMRGRNVRVEEFAQVEELLLAATARQPQLIFLDVSLERSDAVEAIRGLAHLSFTGAIQLMSGRDNALLDNVRRVGERYSLRMLPVLQKPFRLEAVRKVIAEHLPAGNEPVRVAIDEALRNGWLKPWYQPKIDLKHKRLIGIEALARVSHPQHGVLLPGSFLPSADGDSLGRLTEHMLVTTFRDWAILAEAGFHLRPAINVSANLLLKLPLAAIVREHRPKSNTWPGLVLEVTEDEIIRDIDAAHEIATQLKIYDISLAIDDFGAGYSSLSRLKSLPFCELKLDTSFVQNCGSNAENAAICQMVIDLAHRFSSVAVAEGIEEPEDLRALYKMGCDVGQGFLLAPPMPTERLLATLQQRRIRQTVVDFEAAKSTARAAKG